MINEEALKIVLNDKDFWAKDGSLHSRRTWKALRFGREGTYQMRKTNKISEREMVL